MNWADLIPGVDNRVLARRFCAIRTLNRGFGGEFKPEHLSVSMIPNGMYTNEHHPTIGAALQVASGFWHELMEQHGTDTILAAVRAPSRLFWSPRPDMVDAMRTLVENAVAIEDVTLSREVYRFDGTSARSRAHTSRGLSRSEPR